MGGRIDHKTVVFQSAEDRLRLGRRLRGQRGDRLFRLRKLVFEEERERVVERVGARDERDDETRDRRNENESAVTDGS